ncbi:MAG: Gfo/Idh/MocA family oxidoreductase [Bifidobacteriaceae bacterium]|jgi:predicted dehydrogenase|nr:Gfo/Idh/MocA family oxidoreductase [Bifidobacteriaceae bacterium]
MKPRVGIVGLEFGAEFIPIYQAHPNAEMRAICQRSAARLNAVGDEFGVDVRYDRFEDMLADPEIDLIHINTPLHMHADHSVAALRAGKHVGCTIPMAASLEDCKRVVDAQKETGLVYMMMETVVYSREFLFVQQLYRSGELGKLQFLRSSHVQDMTGWPAYWEGLPPMHNATHAISPILCLADNQTLWVQCSGSGQVFQRMQDSYGSPFAVESTTLGMKDSDLRGEVTRSLWAVARQYRESFDVYGSLRSFEWEQVHGAGHVIYTGETPERVSVPDFADRLPAEIRRFTTEGVYSSDGETAHLSFIQGSGHGGSHPHLADRLIRAVSGEADPYPDAIQAANITGAGICSHQSALSGGLRVALPRWTISERQHSEVVQLDQSTEPPWRGLSGLAGQTTTDTGVQS